MEFIPCHVDFQVYLHFCEIGRESLVLEMHRVLTCVYKKVYNLVYSTPTCQLLIYQPHFLATQINYRMA